MNVIGFPFRGFIMLIKYTLCFSFCIPLLGADFSLDQLTTNPQVFNLTLLDIQSNQNNYFQASIYPNELTFSSSREHKQNFLSYNVAESVLYFSNNELSKAYILLKYTPNERNLPELKETTQELLQKFDKMADKKLDIETVEFSNKEKFKVYKWVINNAYVLLYSRPALPGAFVSVRITPKKNNNIPSALENLKTRILPNVSICADKSKILPVPMRRQLPGMDACSNTTLARQLNYWGSDIDQQMVICMANEKGKSPENTIKEMGKKLGYSVEYKTVNKKPVECCIELIEKYNSIAKANNRPEIAVKSTINDVGEKGEVNAKYSWGDNFNNMEQNIISQVKFNDISSYRQFREMVISNINNNIPIGWTVKRHSEKGKHRRTLIGYDLDKDIIYYTDPWFNCDKRSMPFLAAYCMSVWLQIVKK